MWILHEAGCTNPRDQATEIINCEKKEMLPLTKEEKWSYYKTKTMQHMQKKKLMMNLIMMNFIVRFKIPLINKGKSRDAANSACTLKCKTAKEIPMVLHNG